MTDERKSKLAEKIAEKDREVFKNRTYTSGLFKNIRYAVKQNISKWLSLYTILYIFWCFFWFVVVLSGIFIDDVGVNSLIGISLVLIIFFIGPPWVILVYWTKKIRKKYIQSKSKLLVKKEEKIDYLVKEVTSNINRAHHISLDVKEFIKRFNEIKSKNEYILYHNKDIKSIKIESLNYLDERFDELIEELRILKSDVESAVEEEEERKEKKDNFDTLLMEVKENIQTAEKLSLDVSNFVNRKGNIVNRYESVEYDEMDLTSLKEADSELETLTGELKSLKSEIDSSIEEQRERSERRKELRQELNEAESKVRKRFNEVQERLEEIDLEPQSILSRKKDLYHNYESVTPDDSISSKEDAIEEYERIKLELDGLQDHIEQIENVEKEVSELLDEEKNLDTREIETALEEGDVDEAKQLLSDLKDRYGEYEKTLSRLKELDEKRSNLAEKLADDEIDRRDFRDARDDIEHKKADLEEKLNKLRMEVIYEDYEKPF